MILEFDFKLYKDKQQQKSFTFRNDDDTYYDLTDGTVKLLYYKTNIPIEIVGVTDIATGSATFDFSAGDADTAGISEYIIEETKSGGDVTVLLKGNINVQEYVPFSDNIEAYLQAELPVGMVLDDHFVSQKIKYWQLFLQYGQDISDANVHVESAWPMMVNILIAKLVAYDALASAIKGNLLTVFGSSVTSSSTGSSSSTNAGGVKSIETGPTKVEFHPAGDTMNQIIKSSSGSSSGAGGTMEGLAQDLCGLANQLTIKLPMCKGYNVCIPFEKTSHTFGTSIPIEYCSTQNPSRG